jgi:hypothetical protein
MTAAVGMDLGAEMAAGEPAGLEQGPVTATRLGKELSTNWLRPASGNLATPLASEAPSFRSSWQSQVNAWRGVSRGTNGVESEDASEAGTVDTTHGAPMSRVEKSGQAPLSAQAANSSLQWNGAVTRQNVSVPDVAGQKEVWSDTGRSPWKAVQNRGTQTTSTESTDATATERPDTANRNRVGSASQQANQENTAQAATVGAQAIAPAIEAPVPPLVPPAQSQISKPAQTTEATSAPESDFTLSKWPSAQFSGSAQLPGAAEIASTATGSPATGANGSSTSSAYESDLMLLSWRSTQFSGSAQLPGAAEIASTATSTPATGANGSGTHSAYESDLTLSSRRSTQLSGSAQLSGAVEIASAATGSPATGANGSGAAAASESDLTLSSRRSTQLSGSAQLSGAVEIASAATGAPATGANGSGTASAFESDLALSSRRSTQFSGSAQLPGAEEIASAATGRLATGANGSGAAAGVRTHTMHTSPAFIPRNATESEAMHETAASSLGDADEPAASQQMTPLYPPEARSAESRHEPSIAQTSATNESLSGQSVPTSSKGNLNHPATVEGVALSAAPLATVSGAAQASPDAVQDTSKPFTDRATARAANRDATGESIAGATQISAAQPAGVDAAASSGLRIPGAPQISTAPAPHDQPVAAAASAAATTRDTFSALDAGTSPGTPAWTHAGSQHAEAGFRDPALGWVSVRADLNGGGIHATLVPSSAEAAQALNGHLAGLSTHLVEQQSPVASLTMASPSESGVENGMGQRMQQGAEGNPQRNAPEEAQAGSQENAPPASSTSVLDAPVQAGIRDSLTHTGDLRGTHISVMA